MSQALQEFFARVASDPLLQAACAEAAGRGDPEAIVRLGAEAGFGFTADDLKQAWQSQSAELSEEDLAKVAGGSGDPHVGLALAHQVPDCFSGIGRGWVSACG